MIRENIEISKQLRRLREMWGYEESTVADYLSVTESELWDIENSGDLEVSKLIKLCDLYAIRFDDLMCAGKELIPFTMRYKATKDLETIADAHKIFTNFMEIVDKYEEIKSGH